MLEKFCLLLAWVFILTSCAKTSTIPVADFYGKSDATIVIASIASTNHMTVGTTGEQGGGFGAIGVLAELANTSSIRKTQQDKLIAAVGEWRAENVLRETVAAQLKLKNRSAINTRRITPLPPSIAPEGTQEDTMDKIAPLWYNPDKTVFDHTSLKIQYRPDMIIEAGFQGYEIKESKKFGWVTGISVLLKVINPETGAVIGRSRTYMVPAINDRGIIGKFDLNDPSQISPFLEKFKNVFSEEVTKLSREGLDLLDL